MKKNQPRTRRVTLNNRVLHTRGLKPGIWRDINHRAMTARWPSFFASAAVIFICFNMVFVLLYALGQNPIANTPDASLIWLFYFSIETLATVGYGDMHPQTHWGHVIATIEIFTGMSFLAVYTGLIFARFSRPQARFMFATHAVIGPENGKPTLMIRLANERQNSISGATARLWLLRNEPDGIGKERRRFIEMKLLRTDNPVFALSWTLYHVIDDESPLQGLDHNALAAVDGALILTLTGVDDSSGMELHARHVYGASQVRWQHRYADIIARNEAGEPVIDYGKLHDVQPVTE